MPKAFTSPSVYRRCRRRKSLIKIQNDRNIVLTTRTPNARTKRSIPSSRCELLRRREISGRHEPMMQVYQIMPCRRIPFRDLKTPPSEIILGLDATGDYIIGLEARDGKSLELIQRGLPSSSLSPISFNPNNFNGAPTVRRIPLPCPENMAIDMESLVAMAPIEIILSGDMGVARIYTSFCQNHLDEVHNTQGEEVCGSHLMAHSTMVVFHIPTGQSASCQTILLNRHPSTVLWKVSQVPSGLVSDGSVASWYPDISCPTVTMSHLIVNDEIDGFRLTWISAAACDDDIRRRALSSGVASHPGSHAPSSFIAFEKTTPWQQHDGDCQSINSAHSGKSSMIAAEAFLHMDQLLHRMQSRRPTLFGLYQQDVSYTLVSVDKTGQFLTVAICFTSYPVDRDNQVRQRGGGGGEIKPVGTIISVVVRVNVYSGTYEELEWASKQSNKSTPTPTTQHHGSAMPSSISILSMMGNRLRTQDTNDGHLQSLSLDFALHFRMKELRIGPYASCTTWTTRTSGIVGMIRTTKASTAAASLAIQRLLLNDGYYHPPVQHLQQQRHCIKNHEPSNREADNNIMPTMSMLYPDCTVLTNAAVVRGIPVQSFQCASGKTAIVYC